MKLVIAEKPSVAMGRASVLGARTRKDGYVEGNGYIVSWCPHDDGCNRRPGGIYRADGAFAASVRFAA